MKEKELNAPRDGEAASLWQTTVDPLITAEKLPEGKVDVVVVGGGITGCTTALELARTGLRCVLVEARTIGFGTTGGTTAHLNTILDHMYPEINKNFGVEAGQALADGLQRALLHVEANVLERSIDCGFAWKDGLLFSRDKTQSSLLEKIMEETSLAGVHAQWAGGLPIPVEHQKVLRLDRQAQMHPLEYINGLAKAFMAEGGVVVEHSRVLEVEEGDTLRVITSSGMVTCDHLVYATHIPPGVNMLHFRCAPYRSYVLAALLVDQAYPDALVYDMEDPYHYYRTQEVGGKKHLIAGGKDHKTGHEEQTTTRMQDLEEHVRAIFNVQEITHRWSSQYYETTDGLPYIGRMPGAGDNIHVATGFSGNGMTLGTLSGLMLTEQITGRNTIFGSLSRHFDPRRISPVAGFTQFVKENADVVGHMISKPFLASKIKGVEEIGAGEGRLVDHEGVRMGLYKDHLGGLHAVDPVCPHAKCTVKWNEVETSWDCPCHGSRFSVDGELLTGPSRRDLERIPITVDGKVTGK